MATPASRTSGSTSLLRRYHEPEILRCSIHPCCLTGADAGHVRLYPSGSELLGDKDIDQIECVIIDQNMPGLHGTDVLLQIERRGLALPSVLITGAVDSEITAAAQRLGAMTVMVKPILSDELLSFVEAAVG